MSALFNIMTKCLICGIEAKNNVELSKHIHRCHCLTTKEYYDKYLKREVEGICHVCGKETRFLNISNGYSKHCSSKCSGNSTETKNKSRKTCLERY